MVSIALHELYRSDRNKDSSQLFLDRSNPFVACDTSRIIQRKKSRRVTYLAEVLRKKTLKVKVLNLKDSLWRMMENLTNDSSMDSSIAKVNFRIFGLALGVHVIDKDKEIKGTNAQIGHGVGYSSAYECAVISVYANDILADRNFLREALTIIKSTFNISWLLIESDLGMKAVQVSGLLVAQS
ncbi:unnamed protein product [Dovyalis caffra]|uniref:Uncharacterized protein n=1 Tax=Dovyalis caffra TaxID=77055 RepID=A0AAV1SGM4_9ROSI|nr:unnamed protein product [Dovyalis caffra]